MIGRDPFLIAYASVSADRVVVTKEVSKPSKQGANRKIPDVCNDLGVKCISSSIYVTDDVHEAGTLGWPTPSAMNAAVRRLLEIAGDDLRNRIQLASIRRVRKETALIL